MKPKPKFQRGDIVFIGYKPARAGAATFTVRQREYSNSLRTWFYGDGNGPTYAQSLLRLAAPKLGAEQRGTE